MSKSQTSVRPPEVNKRIENIFDRRKGRYINECFTMQFAYQTHIHFPILISNKVEFANILCKMLLFVEFNCLVCEAILLRSVSEYAPIQTPPNETHRLGAKTLLQKFT